MCSWRAPEERLLRFSALQAIQLLRSVPGGSGIESESAIQQHLARVWADLDALAGKRQRSLLLVKAVRL